MSDGAGRGLGGGLHARLGTAAVSELIVRLGHDDPKVRNLAVMDLTRLADDARAREALWAAYRDPATPARVAHAAILAHDGAHDRAHGQAAGGGNISSRR